MMALLKAQQINKSDRNDARGIAQMMRVGLFKPVHVKTQMAQEQRILLTSRKLLQRKLLDVESDLRGTLRNFGLKVGVVSTGKIRSADPRAGHGLSQARADRRATACRPGSCGSNLPSSTKCFSTRSAMPVRLYWSATVYDRATHALIRDQKIVSRSSLNPGTQKNADGSVDIYFGPKVPTGKESNWVPTSAGGRFEVLFRLYGPEKPLFDKTWVLPDIERTAVR